MWTTGPWGVVCVSLQKRVPSAVTPVSRRRHSTGDDGAALHSKERAVHTCRVIICRCRACWPPALMWIFCRRPAEISARRCEDQKGRSQVVSPPMAARGFLPPLLSSLHSSTTTTPSLSVLSTFVIIPSKSSDTNIHNKMVRPFLKKVGKVLMDEAISIALQEARLYARDLLIRKDAEESGNKNTMLILPDSNDNVEFYLRRTPACAGECTHKNMPAPALAPAQAQVPVAAPFHQQTEGSTSSGATPTILPALLARLEQDASQTSKLQHDRYQLLDPFG